MNDLVQFMDRCACETRFDRCIRPATGEDGHCDGCRDVRPNGGSRDHHIKLVTEDELAAMNADPATVWRAAHYAVVTPRPDRHRRPAGRPVGREVAVIIPARRLMAHDDDDDLFTTEEAAAEVGVEPTTIYTWCARGYLAPVPGKKRGRSNLFKLEDVFACEKARIRKHRKRSPGANLLN